FGRNFPNDVSDYRWLEKYNALKLYQLASNGWRVQLLDSGITEEQLGRWENGEGESLEMPGFLPAHLFDWILPRVTEVQLVKGTIYPYPCIKPPTQGWRAVLSCSYDYFSAPIRWGTFAEYVGEIEALLYSVGSLYINARYEGRLGSFEKDELEKLRDLFNELGFSEGGL